MIAPDAYCREIEAYLCRKNEGHLIRISGPAFEQVCGWARQGVPLTVDAVVNLADSLRDVQSEFSTVVVSRQNTGPGPSVVTAKGEIGGGGPVLRGLLPVLNRTVAENGLLEARRERAGQGRVIHEMPRGNRHGLVAARQRFVGRRQVQ